MDVFLRLAGTFEVATSTNYLLGATSFFGCEVAPPPT